MELLHDQNFDRIQKKHSELGVPWTDPTFSASDASIGLSKIKDLPHNIQWKRPYVSCCYHYFLHDKNTIEMDWTEQLQLTHRYLHFQEITTGPKLFVDGMSAGDVTQGSISNRHIFFGE